jgi:hypothetical protein
MQFSQEAFARLNALSKEAMKVTSDNDGVKRVTSVLQLQLLQQQFREQVELRKRARFSTEALTFLLGIALSLFGIIVDLPNEEKKMANLSFGLSCAFLGPLIIKRMVFDIDDDKSTLSAVVETVFIPSSLVCIMVGVGTVTIGIDYYTGIIICCIGSITFFGYFGASIFRIYSEDRQKNIDDKTEQLTIQINKIVLDSLGLQGTDKIKEEAQNTNDDSETTP